MAMHCLVLFVFSFFFSSMVISALDRCQDKRYCNSYCKNPSYPVRQYELNNCMRSCGVCTDVSNVAYLKLTKQSSTAYDGESDRAVDGDTSNDYNRNSCTHTGLGATHWWCVDLSAVFDISQVQIFNVQGNEQRLEGFEMKLDTQGTCSQQGSNMASLCYIDRSNSPQLRYVISSCNADQNIELKAKTVYITATKRFMNLCEVQIFSKAQCSDGYYSTSNATCAPCDTCEDNSCSADTGECLRNCKLEWYGDKCQKKCNSGCRTSCDKNTGECTNGCIDNFQGRLCDECVNGKYGDLCELNCSPGCYLNVCSRNGGQCIHSCNEGFVGRYCDDCTLGKYGPKCDMSCITANCKGNCDRNQGHCATCNDGWYGPNCRIQCSSNCDKNCDKNSGRCLQCKIGFMGENCEQTCPPNCQNGCKRLDGRCNGCKINTYGNYCNNTCGSECKPISGGKSSSCDENGWCRDCINGRYGDYCNITCDIRCGECWRTTGRCKNCLVGFYGYECDKNCSLFCTGGCSIRVGNCMSCKTGKFGNRCNEDCSRLCKNGCSKGTGSCNACVDGKSGSKCDRDCLQNCLTCKQNNQYSCESCKKGKWGLNCDNNCSVKCRSEDGGQVPLCNVTTGLCDIGCVDGKFGADCQQSCNDTCAMGVCFQSSGECSQGCVPGMIGKFCEEECGNGTYGRNCQETCGKCAGNSPCHKGNGSCGLVGCMDGFTGLTCHSQRVPMFSTPIVWIILIVVIVTVSAVAGFLLFKRRRQKNLAKKNVEDSLTVDSDKLETESPEQVGTSLQEYGNKYNDVPNSGENIYQNFGEETKSFTRIRVKDINTLLKNTNMVEKMKSEYKDLPKGLCAAHDYSLNAVNKPKNRYNNICAFDHSRVVLNVENGDPTSDYINACYITGHNSYTNKYIASQGPVESNINEFWRMIWDVKCNQVVMLTNLLELGVPKCMKYWPEIGKWKTFGNISVKMVEEEKFAHFTVRILNISKVDSETRSVRQYHYTSWPDKGVPVDASSLIEFRNIVKMASTNEKRPLVVHCSAGIGRTGTFLVLDYEIEEAESEGSIDIAECVKQMRYERVNMVQTFDQYLFVHEALSEWNVTGNATFSMETFHSKYQLLLEANPQTGRTKLAEMYEQMNSLKSETKLSHFSNALSDENKSKNRDSSIVPSDSVRICLSIPVSKRTDYINAAFLTSYRKKKTFIITQAPLEDTLVDFWRMVVEWEIHTVINIDVSETATDIAKCVPDKGSITCGPFTITRQNEKDNNGEFFDVVTCLVKNKNDDDVEILVRFYECNFWDEKRKVPTSITPVSKLLEDVTCWSENNEEAPAIVHCLDGAKKSGLLCTIVNLLERMSVERSVNIPQTILQLRVTRPQIIPNYEQFKFCFDIVDEHVNDCGEYANYH